MFQACVSNTKQIYTRDYTTANPLKTVTNLNVLKSLFNPRLLNLAEQALQLHPVLPFEHECEVFDAEQFNLDIRVGKVFGPFVSHLGSKVSIGQIRGCRMHGWFLSGSPHLIELKVFYRNAESGFVLAVADT
jgi:hypothetical protein